MGLLGLWIVLAWYCAAVVKLQWAETDGGKW